MPTISQISADLRASPTAHRALRTAAALGALGPGVAIDGRGTMSFGAYAPFRAALVLALARAGIHGADAAALIVDAADGLPEAVEAVAAGTPTHFRVGTWANGARAARFARVGDPLPGDAESLLVIFAPAAWAPLLSSLKDE